jgi:5-deoxy-glucuronate isomerase
VSARDIHPLAIPNDLPPEALHLRPAADGQVALDPSTARWRYLAFRVVTLAEYQSLTVGEADRETAIVNLFGGDLVVDVAGERLPELLRCRRTVFDQLPTAFYLPAGEHAELTSMKCGQRVTTTVAIAQAPSTPDAGLRPVAIGRDDIRVEIRGAGNATRQVNHIIAPEFPADRLLLVEVLTPSGNWSSWPPHKHDEDRMPDEAVLEEVYHYRFRRPEAWAIQRLYRRPERGLPARDAAWTVRDGDVVLVTDGYHPFVATHGDDAYYLNALAGDRRTMACSFDPDLDWVRDSWSRMDPDPRLPMVAGSSDGDG